MLEFAKKILLICIMGFSTLAPGSLSVYNKDSPDEIGIYGPTDGIMRVVVRWRNKTFELSVIGSIEDDKNQKLMKDWLVRCLQEVNK